MIGSEGPETCLSQHCETRFGWLCRNNLWNLLYEVELSYVNKSWAYDQNLLSKFLNFLGYQNISFTESCEKSWNLKKCYQTFHQSNVQPKIWITCTVFNFWMHLPLQIQWRNIMNADFLKKDLIHITYNDVLFACGSV